MCHELGHGFGLPHWDEDFFNRNMGNCMDYTSNPRSNRKPDRSNFEFLAELYGEVGSTPSSASSGPQPVPSSPGMVGWGRNGRRGKLRSMLSTGDMSSEEEEEEEVPPSDEVLRSFYNALNEFEVSAGQSNWQLLNSDTEGDVYEIDLGGFIARAFLLRA